MADAKKTDLENSETNYDAEQLVQDIAVGEEKAPKVNVEADYERSKQFDVAEVDRTDAGAEAASTASGLTSPSSEAATGNPTEFLDMAKEVTPKEEK